MDSIFDRIKDKVNELGNQKVLLMDQVNKLRLENEELNKELIELKASMQNREQEMKSDLSSPSKNMDGKIDDMVKEIDKCIAILNID